MYNIHVKNCKYGKNSLITVKSDANFEMNKGIIEGNSGGEPVFFIGSNAHLNLEDVTFQKNTQWTQKSTPSCIKADNNSNINLNKCDFLNHASQEYPFSAFIIETKGQLNIKSTKFNNNRAEKQYISSIRVTIFYKLIIFFI